MAGRATIDTTFVKSPQMLRFEKWHISNYTGINYKANKFGYLNARTQLDFEIWQGCEAQYERKGWMWKGVESISLYEDEFFTVPLYAMKDALVTNDNIGDE